MKAALILIAIALVIAPISAQLIGAISIAPLLEINPVLTQKW